MYASELIAFLAGYIKEHGDQEIMLQIDDTRGEPWSTHVEYDPDTNEVQGYCIKA